MEADVLRRMKRMYFALGTSVERDLSKFPARIFSRDRNRLVMQDFSGGRTEPELYEVLHWIINSLGSFCDHLVNWGKKNRISPDSIYNFLRASHDYCLVKDLCNTDKHGYPLTKPEWSKKSPRILAARCVCELTTSPSVNSTVGIMLGKNGQPVPYGDGSVEVVVTGEVVDPLGGGLGEAHKIVRQAVKVCETALLKFGVVTSLDAIGE